MPECQACGDDADELQTHGRGANRQKLCEDCHEDAVREEEIAAEAEGVMGGMMEYKG